MGMTGRPPLPTVTVAQDGSGDYNGTTEKPIQDALDSLSATGGWVHIKPGTYNISSTITVPAYTKLTGTLNTNLKLTEDANVNLLEDSGNFIEIEGLFFNSFPQSSSSDLLHLTHNYHTITRCYFGDSHDFAIYLDGSAYRITNNYITSTIDGGGIKGYTLTDSVISSLILYTHDANGIFLEDSHRCFLTNANLTIGTLNLDNVDKSLFSNLNIAGAFSSAIDEDSNCSDNIFMGCIGSSAVTVFNMNGSDSIYLALKEV